MHKDTRTFLEFKEEKTMLKYLLALSLVLMGAAAASADTTITIKINERAPYTVTLLRGGKNIGSNTGKGSQRVRIKANSADKFCVKFSGGYAMKTPDGRILVQSCRPIAAAVPNIWGHNNIIKQ